MLKIGILGGGQLGRMLLQQAPDYPIETFVLEATEDSPAAHLCHHFVKGNINDYETVLQFGRKVDVLTIEIEHVNVDALFQLEKEGVKIFPKPEVLQTIKDKGLQKQFYEKHNIPSPPFVLTENDKDILNHLDFLPAAHKLRTGGYDGKGVQLILNESEAALAFNEPSVLEQLVIIEKEIAVIIARNETGETAIYPPTEMVFDSDLNLVDYLLSPAELNDQQTSEAQQLALQVCNAFNSPGIFAVEMFLDDEGKLWVNETAPRAHNSGHHSIEGNYCSQYDMQLRVLQNLPLGNSNAIQPSLMLNVLGEPGHSGKVKYVGLDAVMDLANVYIHLYGKTTTKPGRKMGHVTILGNSQRELMTKAEVVRNSLKVESE
jgi:5-(carboxyamino)imidazole ribonucleotide synthase